MSFYRVYADAEDSYICGVLCDVRGGFIRESKEFDPSLIDCPGCLAVLKTGAA